MTREELDGFLAKLKDGTSNANPPSLAFSKDTPKFCSLFHDGDRVEGLEELGERVRAHARIAEIDGLRAATRGSG